MTVLFGEYCSGFHELNRSIHHKHDSLSRPVTSTFVDDEVEPGPGLSVDFEKPVTRMANTMYPICPTFSHWRFPHNNLPPSCSGYNIVTTVAQDTRQDHCCVTRSTFPLKTAHVLPIGHSEDNWCRDNYANASESHPRPIILLKPSLYDGV
jgi:hypothetical protein